MEKEREFYSNIRDKDRFFEQYFYVQYIGDFPPKFKVFLKKFFYFTSLTFNILILE